MPPEIALSEIAPALADAPAAMTARAALRCEQVDGVTRITRLRSEGQLVLRPTNPKAFEPWARGDAGAARVSLSAGAAGPLGGDRLALDVEVGEGAVLVLNEISATLALPGTRGERSELRCTVRVGAGATLIWMPEPVIAARGCDHSQLLLVELDPTARFYVREQLITGRHGESPGSIRQRVRVTRGGRAVYDQSLELGPQHVGWDSPAVTGGAKALGAMLVVDPGSLLGRDRSDLVDASTVSVGLADDVVQATAVAPDSLALSRSLDAALALLGSPWSPL